MMMPTKTPPTFQGTNNLTSEHSVSPSQFKEITKKKKTECDEHQKLQKSADDEDGDEELKIEDS